MKPDKKQIPQLIVLGLLVLVCIGYVSFQVMKPGDVKPTRKTDSATVQSAAAEPEAKALITPDTGAISVFPDLSRSLSRRDPFVPQRLPGEMPPDDTGASRVRNTRPRPTNMRLTPFAGKLPRFDIKPIDPFDSAGGSSLPKPPTRASEPPKFVLTGVIRGAENVAILRVGTEGRYVVKQGQTIEGRYTVLLVMSDAVVLNDRGRRIFVRLGGEQNAS